MELVQSGSFWMGCNEVVDSCIFDELPYHQLVLSAFYIDKTEVSTDAYAECVNAGICSEPRIGGYCNWKVNGREEHPVNCVTWYQAESYCEWAEKRLPTEAEWEKAARGSDGRLFPWGNDESTCDYAVMYWNSEYGCGAGGTMATCSKSPAGDSPYGLCDMAGNVWEWCHDWYVDSYYGVSPDEDPFGPSSGSFRVIRGGAFYLGVSVQGLRSVDRFYNNPSSDFNGFIGFRCVRDAQ